VFSGVQYPISLPSEVGDNVQYLEFYHYCAGPSLASAFDHDFWSRTCLQIAHSEPAVRHALISLAYLSRQETGSLKHARLRDHNGDQPFLLHYNKSLRQLVDRMAETSFSPEVGLVTCLLFVCIEFLRADHHTAWLHLKQGLKIIAELQHRRRINAPTQPPGAVQELLITPRQSFVEEMFVRSMSSPLLHGLNVDEHFTIPHPLPQTFARPFTNVREAQSSFHQLRNISLVYFRHMAMKIIVQCNSVMSEADIIHQDRVLDCLSTWFCSLQTLESSTTLSEEDKVTVSSLKVSYYAIYIYAAAGTDVSQMSFDTHLATFQALLRHARIVLHSMRILERASNTEDMQVSAGPSSHPRSVAANFTFEISLIPYLYVTAQKCRCPVTRREAVQLLSLNLPREGLWDAEQHAIVCKRAIEMEETTVDENGWPIEESRLWSSTIDPNMDTSGGFLVHFCPARWVGIRDEMTGRQKTLQEWIIMGEQGRWRRGKAGGHMDPVRVAFQPETAPLH
jgi:hypothetical protein